MSGGVDSLRTASLLKDQGHDVFALHMKLFTGSPGSGHSPEAPQQSRREVLDQLVGRLGIQLIRIDMQQAFEASVIVPFLRAYRQGLTPNPCVLCNPRIKFDLLLREARERGAERLATGHYARILPPAGRGGRYRLCRGRDPGKDQSYFLYGLSQQQLASALFPLGGSRKQEVLEWARKEGFSAYLPAESQEICFIPSGSYQDFFRQATGFEDVFRPGPILDQADNLVGQHKGIFAYTIGQRRGLGIASTAPYYVTGLEPDSNTVRVGRAADLYQSECRVAAVNWVAVAAPDKAIHCQVRIRNQHRPAAAWVAPSPTNGAVTVQFDEPQRAVTPGQAAVFYDGEEVLGGGTICRRK